MNSIRRRAGHLESAVGVCLLIVLFLIGLGIFIKQFSYDNARFGIDAAAIPKLEIQSSTFEAHFQLTSFMPDGFDALSELEVYDPENLYEKINGKADQYLESGFEKLSTQRFVSKEDENLWMELFIYDMANTRNAFSVYSLQRRADADTISFFEPSFGYKTSNALYFCQGKYYVELVGSAESKQLFDAIIKTAQNIKTNLAVRNDVGIPELNLFPTEGIIPGSIKLHLKNAFGFEKLTDTFTARYKVNDVTITAFLSKRSSSESADAIAESYHRFLIENGAKAKNAANKTFEGKTLDFYATTEIIFTRGPFVAGVHEAENQQAAEKVAAKLNDKLSEAAKAGSNG